MLRLIVGLGNPGQKYVGTRHNFGRAVVDALAKKLGAKWKTWHGHGMAEVRSQKSEVRSWLLLPGTFMNVSGQAVGEFARFHKLSSEEVLVTHDELDLPLGRIALRTGGSAGGHHGVESVIEHMGTRDFWRLRLGIWSGDRSIGKIGERTSEEVSNFVLSRFRPEEQALVGRVVDAAINLLIESLENPPKSQSKTIE